MMAKKAYAFSLGQRVSVPGKKNVQGVVSLPTTVGDGLPILPNPGGGVPEHVFLVRWIGENGEREAGNFRASELTAANTQDGDAHKIVAGASGGCCIRERQHAGSADHRHASQAAQEVKGEALPQIQAVSLMGERLNRARRSIVPHPVGCLRHACARHRIGLVCHCNGAGMTTAAQIRDCVAKFLVTDPAGISPDARIDDLIKDEIRVIDLIESIEHTFGCDIPDTEITTTATMGQLAALVDRHKISVVAA